MLTLYFAPGTCALATHLALEHAGADYRAERLDFSAAQQRTPEYLRINPKGRVPALVTPQGVLTETPALLQYVAQTHPQANLLPLDDVFQLARANEFNSYLCSTVHVAHAHRTRGARWTDDEAAQQTMKKKVPQNMGECFDLIERHYLQGPWVLGERVSACDYYLFTVSRWLEGDGVDIKGFPKANALVERLMATDVVRKVMAEHA
jgi:glutathione S-transferase